MISMILLLFLIIFDGVVCGGKTEKVIGADFKIDVPFLHNTSSCLGRSNVNKNPSCYSRHCARTVIDGLFSDTDINNLREIARKGMGQRVSVGGPTILDINTGYVRDSAGMENLFADANSLFLESDFDVYGSIVNKLKEHVGQTFGVQDLYFTAPTFITRLDATIPWKAKGMNARILHKLFFIVMSMIEIHDEYWHVHADMNNTEHYQYSGLLYLSTYNEDFTGGMLP